MVDIQITGVEDPGDGFLYIMRTVDGVEKPNKMHKETLACRAAEYNLEVDDPRVLDMLLMEPFVIADPDEVAPLYRHERIEDALEEVMARIEDAKERHGAPKDPVMRSLFHAADLEESTQGLTDVKAALMRHADPEVMIWVKDHRDRTRAEWLKPQPPKMNLLDDMRSSGMAIAYEAAKAEDVIRKPQKG